MACLQQLTSWPDGLGPLCLGDALNSALVSEEVAVSTGMLCDFMATPTVLSC